MSILLRQIGALKDLFEAGALKSVAVAESNNGQFFLVISLKEGNQEFRLCTQRNQERAFASVNTAIKVCRDIGFRTLKIELSQHINGSQSSI